LADSNSVLFIADLHLKDQNSESLERFTSFLKDKARNAQALYILGDLFEYYIGDDVAIQAKGVIATTIKEIKKLTEVHKTKCYFMAGNRDFLVSSQFSQSSNMTILQDPSNITVDGKNITLAHGDHLCTDDHSYQKVRQQIRSAQWQQWFLNLPIKERRAFAENAREKSQQHTQTSNPNIMDVNPQAVNELFAQQNTTTMIHGHTHRPAFHLLEIDNIEYHRMVLGDWHHQTSYIEYKNNNFQLVTC